MVPWSFMSFTVNVILNVLPLSNTTNSRLVVGAQRNAKQYLHKFVKCSICAMSLRLCNFLQNGLFESAADVYCACSRLSPTWKMGIRNSYWMSNLVLQTLTLFRIKTCNFPGPFYRPASRSSSCKSNRVC